MIYHEGRAFRVTKAKLPAEGRLDNGQLSTTTLILCPECGAAHTDELQERCHACAAPLGGAERLDTVFRIDNVETAPSERITANDEDRQRRGFEIQTVFQWPIHNGSPDIRSTTLCADDTELLRLDYLTRVLRMTLLAPDIVDAILDGRQGDGMDLATLAAPFPNEWGAQRRHFGLDA